MKITLAVILCVLLIPFLKCTNKSAVNVDDKRQLLDLERAWLEHEFALDTAFLASIMDPTFVGISEDGVKNKQEDLLSMYNNIDQRIKNGIVIDSFRIEDEVVNVYENSAVVTFIVHTYRHSNDSLIERKTRFYDVWIRRGDKWKAVASQGTTIQE
ncbi:MAG TPA: nuclear transport factor 2 family protein [Chryseolinea sp.]